MKLEASLARNEELFDAEVPVWPDALDFLRRFEAADGEARKRMAYSLSRAELEAVAEALPAHLDVYPAGCAGELLALRWQGRLFRRLYLVWQEQYQNKRFCDLLADQLENRGDFDDTACCGYSHGEFCAIARSEKPLEALMVHVRRGELSLLDYLDTHRIRRSSRLALDSMSIFYLFCDYRDYREIGADRLTRLLPRFPRSAQRRILKNMLARIPADGLADFAPALDYLAGVVVAEEGE